MGVKSAKVMQLISVPQSYPTAAIQALARFKREHKESQDAIGARFEGMKVLVAELAAAYNKPIPRLLSLNASIEAPSTESYFSPQTGIVMVGRLSLITLLHEFAHYLGMVDEDQARGWSLSLFKLVYPIAFNVLCMNNPDDPEDFVLVSPNRCLQRQMETQASFQQLAPPSIELPAEELSRTP